MPGLPVENFLPRASKRVKMKFPCRDNEPENWEKSVSKKRKREREKKRTRERRGRGRRTR